MPISVHALAAWGKQQTTNNRKKGGEKTHNNPGVVSNWGQGASNRENKVDRLPACFPTILPGSPPIYYGDEGIKF
ncbi:MAG: hypothetical protein Fur0021_24980 [Candidatus Promineifilaceae bacterium]